MDIKKIRNCINKIKEASEISYINVYEWETALLVYEFLDDQYEKITDDDIKYVYNLVHSKDNIFDEYLREEIRELEQEKELVEEKEQDAQELEK